MNQPKVLVLDIETSPHLVWTWGLFKQYVSIDQIEEPSRMLSWAAKWHGERGTRFGAEWTHNGWVEELADLITDADAVVHYNGKTFDMPIIRREVEEAGLPPLPPVQQIDLLATVRKFRLASNKLDWAGYTFVGQRKVSHDGFPLWKRVMEGDPAARKMFERYNRGDVVLTDRLLSELKRHIPSYPSASLISGDTTDPECRCGARDFQRRGFYRTDTRKYQRYSCNKCGAWFRDTRSVGSIAIKGI